MSITEDRLIDLYIDPSTEESRIDRSSVRLKEYGVPIWALIGHLQVVDGDLNQVAADYEIPRDAVEAAVAYYERNRAYIDARLLLNKS